MPSFKFCAFAGLSLLHASQSKKTPAHTPPVTRGISKMEAEMAPGGAVHDLLHELRNAPYNATHPSSGWRGPIKTLPDGSFEQTFLSAPMVLKPGEIANDYRPVHWPEGHIAITGMTGDVVRLKPGAKLELGLWPDVVTSTRDESYFHHWTFNHWQVTKKMFDSLANGRPFSEADPDIGSYEAGQNTGMQSPCESGLLHFRFGGGNELRGAAPGTAYSYELPAPYAFESNSDQMDRMGLIWLVNSHLMDVRNVTDLRGCTECRCDVTHGHSQAGRKYTGGLGCCHSTPVDGSKCPVSVLDEDAVENTYFFKHTLRWEAAPWDDSVHKHVEIVTLDVSDNGHTWGGAPIAESLVPGHFHEGHEALLADDMSVASLATRRSGIAPAMPMCHAEYFVPPCADPTGNCVHVFNNSWTMPFSGIIIGSFSHFHAGAISQSTYTNDGLVCRSPPVYDDQGHIDFIPRCLQDEVCETATCGLKLPVALEEGEKIFVETKYQQDAQPHHGVMGYSILMIHRTDYKNLIAV